MGSADDYVESIKSAVIKIGVEQVMTLLIAEAPFFGYAIINPVASWLVGKVITLLVTKTEIAAFFIYTDIRVNKQGNAFVEAAMKYRAAQLSGDKNAIEKEAANLKARFREFASVTN